VCLMSCGLWPAPRRTLVAAIVVETRVQEVFHLQRSTHGLAPFLDSLARTGATLVLPARLPSRTLVWRIARASGLAVAIAPASLVAALREVAGFEDHPPQLTAALVARLANFPLFLDQLGFPPRPRTRW